MPGRGRGGGTRRGRRPNQTARGSVPLSLPRVEIPSYAVSEEDTNGAPTPPRSQTPSNNFPDYIITRLPPLKPARGPPVHIDGVIGGMMMESPDDDPRLTAVSMGFPVSVHPLRILNARAQYSTASSVSVIDLKFLRLCGLLHEMVPLRPGVDKVELSGVFGGNQLRVFGWVDIVFDALGYEFKQMFCVINLGLPVDIQLGNDWQANHDIDFTSANGTGNIRILKANAKKVRNLQDTYTTF